MPVDRDKWPPTPSTTYVRLALVKKEKMSEGEADDFTRLTLQGHIDQILQAKQPITMDNILKDNDTNLVVVEGAPGIGKSTFAWELCRQWPTLESLKNFSLVVLLRLREEGLQAATAISDLFFCFDEPNLARCVGEEVRKKMGEGVLLVFDGFDEFPAELRKKSLVTEVIRGSCLPKANVLVTSRPSATADLLSVCQTHLGKHIEIVGFSEEQSQKYAESIFGPKSELLVSFQTYLSVNPVIRGMVYNPLSCGIVVDVYRQSYLSHKPIPHTQTQLYTELSLCLLSRYLSATGDSLARRLPNRLEDIPHDSDLYQQLVRLGRLAFEGKVREEMVFKHLPQGCSTLGLLNTCSELYGRKESVTYSFLHLTLQEYMGAFHISQLPASEQTKLFVNYCDFGHLNVVWRFVAGLTRMQDIGWEKFRGRKVIEKGRVISNVDKGYQVGDGVVEVWPSVVQCLYEAQDVESCMALFHSSKVQYCGQWCSIPFDVYCVGYCVSVCGNEWNVDLQMNGLGPKMVEMLAWGLKSVEYGCGFVKDLDWSDNPIKDEGMKYLQNFPSNILQKLSTLNLSGCGLGQTAFDLLAETLPLMSSLESLDIALNPGGNGSTVKLLQALGKHRSVEQLMMENTGFGRDDVMALSELIQSSQSLRELTTGSYSDVSPDCVQMMVKYVVSPFCLSGLVVLVPFSASPLNYIETISDSLTWLEFRSSGVSSEHPKQLPMELSDRGGIRLSSILRYNTTLKMLLLNLPLEDTEVREIVESLDHNSTLTGLRLSRIYHFQYFSESERQALDHRIGWAS